MRDGNRRVHRPQNTVLYQYAPAAAGVTDERVSNLHSVGHGRLIYLSRVHLCPLRILGYVGRLNAALNADHVPGGSVHSF